MMLIYAIICCAEGNDKPLWTLLIAYAFSFWLLMVGCFICL